MSGFSLLTQFFDAAKLSSLDAIASPTPRIGVLLSLYLKSGRLLEWAMPYRTSDLCRVNAEPLHRKCSLLFNNTCKIASFYLRRFVHVRHCSRGLVYYWGNRASTRHQGSHISVLFAALLQRRS
jgi:hypothetical protein